MKRELKLLSFCSFVFLLGLVVSGMNEGVLSTVVYAVGAIAPFFLLYLAGAEKELKQGTALLKLGKRGAEITAVLAAPTLLLVYILSLLTSLVMRSALGLEASVDIGQDLAASLVREGLFVPLVEEAVFRFIPLILLGKRSPRGAVLWSALLFAFCHASLFSIPYAFVAGLIFAAVDIAAGSVIPSLLLHIVNNVFSVLMIFSGEGSPLSASYPIALAVLTAVSVIAAIIRRREVLSPFRSALRSGEKYIPSYEPYLFIITTAVIAVAELF